MRQERRLATSKNVSDSESGSYSENDRDIENDTDIENDRDIEFSGTEFTGSKNNNASEIIIGSASVIIS